MGRLRRTATKLFGSGQRSRRKAPADELHWQAELAYWTQRMRNWYRDKYGLELAPIQTDRSQVPPFELIERIQTKAKAHPEAFLASGQRTALFYLEALDQQGFDPRRFERILDFGVGLTRLIRHYYPFQAELYGCDVTAEVIDYDQRCCADRVDLRTTALSPPLPYQDGQFDYIYANSVFTHIQTNNLAAWIAELARITHPGGCVIVSLYSTNRYLEHLAEREFDAAIRKQGYIEWGNDDVRENCLYASPETLRSWWGEHFELLDLKTRFKDQDQLVLRKPL